MIKTIPLFALPIYCLKVDPNSYDKQSIIDIVNHNYEIDNHRNKHEKFGNLHHSYDDEKNIDYKEMKYLENGLNKVYDNIFEEFANKCLKMNKAFSYEYSFQNYTASKKSQYMVPHQHLPTCDFASVHYIQFEKGIHNPTNFHNMNEFVPYLNFVRPDMYNSAHSKHIDNSYLFDYYELDIEEDDMIIFPSCLRHEILPQKEQSDKIRITVATNISIKELKK